MKSPALKDHDRVGRSMRLMAMCSSDSIEVLVNVLRNRLDLSVQVVLDIEHVALVVFRDEIDRQTKVTEAA